MKEREMLQKEKHSKNDRGMVDLWMYLFILNAIFNDAFVDGVFIFIFKK
jgi:hypothetical protein